MPRLPNPAMYSDLAVVDADGESHLHMFRAEVRDLTFAAGETVTAASATLRFYDRDPIIAGPVSVGDAASGPILSVALLANVATVRLSGASLTLDAVYRLHVIFDVNEWGRELLIEVVG